MFALLVVCIFLKVVDIGLSSRMAFVDCVTKLLVVNEEEITRRFYRRLLPADLVALLPLWMIHFFFQDGLIKLPIWQRLLCDTGFLCLPIWVDVTLMRTRFFHSARQEQPVSARLKSGKFLAEVLIVFASVVLFTASFWMAVGCRLSAVGVNFEKCRNDSWVYISHHTHDINSKVCNGCPENITKVNLEVS